MTATSQKPECGCCAGVEPSTPSTVGNPPGLPEISYRMGRHGDFLDSMRSRLSSADYPALAALGTREASDFTLAITDALASTLDILAFYTERYSQEHYLRTATERRSVIDLARLIGYRPAPGVAASTHLAFTLKSAPGVVLDPITIPVGTRVQSVPGQDEQAQTFETVEAVPARAEWNAIPVQQSMARPPAFGDLSLWLDGIDTGLDVGDLILIVGAEHEADPEDERWDVRVISAVETFNTRKLTRVSWKVGLGHTKPFVPPAGESVRIYSFRKHTSVFGANAPDWRVLGEEAKLGYLGVDTISEAEDEYKATEWPDFSALAPVYPERRKTNAPTSHTYNDATIEQVIAAATSAAQGAAVAAMHQAARAGTGVVAASGKLAQDAMAFAQHSADGVKDVTNLAINEVASRARGLINSQAQAMVSLHEDANSTIRRMAFDSVASQIAAFRADLAQRVQPLSEMGLDATEVAENILVQLGAALNTAAPEVILGGLETTWNSAMAEASAQIDAAKASLSNNPPATGDAIADTFNAAMTLAGNTLTNLSAAIQDLNPDDGSGQTPDELAGELVGKIADQLGQEFTVDKLAQFIDPATILDGASAIASNLLASGASAGAGILALLRNTAASASAVIGGLSQQIQDIADEAHSVTTGAVDALNPAGLLNTLRQTGEDIRLHSRDAAVSALEAAAAGDVAALVTGALTIARNLPAPFAPETPEQFGQVARYFAALGVARAGGTPPTAPAVDSMLARIESMLPTDLLVPFEAVAAPIEAIIDDADLLTNAPRNAAQLAYMQIDSAVDHALKSTIIIESSGWRPLVREPDTIDINPVNDKVVADDWALLAVPGLVELYRIVEAGVASRAEYLLSGQTTRLKLSGELPDGRLPEEFEFAPRSLAVHVESVELALANEPIAAPLYGQTVALDHIVEGLLAGQPIALSGTRQRILITRRPDELAWTDGDGNTRTLSEGDSLELMEAPVKLVPAPLTLSHFTYKPSFFGFDKGLVTPTKAFLPRSTDSSVFVFYTPVALSPEEFAEAVGDDDALLRLRLRDRDGMVGTVRLHGDDIALEAAHEDDEVVREIAFIADTSDAITHTRDRSTLQLAEATAHVYVRLGTTVNANVAPATHGETVEAILGDGNGSQANQQYTLTQAPLTYVSAATPSGRASTLEVRVNDIRWDEADTLYKAALDEHSFETMQDDDAITTVRFGDGVEGARLPGGTANVRAKYRKGLGVAGNLASGKLATLLSRPLGVSEVVNPEPATGGEDAETLDKARDNAPLTVLTLDRAVSIADYTNFSRAFAGIDKAHALWIPAGPARGVFVTIAGVEGAEVPVGSTTYSNLLTALTDYGDPLMPIRLANYTDARFHARIAVLVDDAYEEEKVLDAVNTALTGHFSFAERAFGQTVSVDEVAAVAKAVDGVIAVHVSQLYRDGQAATLNARLFATLPTASLTGLPDAAELLTLANEGIQLEVLQ